MALQLQRDLEQQVHKEFHSNVHLATLIYPPSAQFQQVFKENMFVKPNKAGFQQVVYYFLGILEPDALKQKITSWPIFDIASENKFRTEVMKYINELNSIYEDANIPLIQTSQLMSPGGFKFIKFMFKLSQLVLFVYLKRSPPREGEVFLLPIKPLKSNAATEEMIEKLKRCTNKIYSDIDEIKQKNDKMEAAALVEAQEIVEKQNSSRKSIKELETKLRVFETQNKENASDQDVPAQVEKIHNLLSKLLEDFSKCRDLNDYLCSSRSMLEYKRPPSLSRDTSEEIETDGNLDLVKMLECYRKSLDKKRLEFKPVSDEVVGEQIKRVEGLNVKLSTAIETLEKLHLEVLEASAKLPHLMEKKESTRRKLIPPQPLLNSTALPGSLAPDLSLVSTIRSTGSDSDSTTLALPLSPPW